ncbi:MAG: hypothetical protein KID00_05760 [Clostridium argentinense]|uniref:hypothetical protein n=1 Tax=Clostridium butanoliproducens TaxID=2991837 RepID=UPI001D77ED28|nr:hypothetical protein [Clostridium butanoliproducens]MBS5823355.1 hypothetical protein [Clostridium argentinense]MDU1348032.1 hypothetical protein [Clostridium argentinense]
MICKILGIFLILSGCIAMCFSISHRDKPHIQLFGITKEYEIIDRHKFMNIQNTYSIIRSIFLIVAGVYGFYGYIYAFPIAGLINVFNVFISAILKRYIRIL